MTKKYPIDEVQDHIEHVKELETEIDRLKDQVDELESDMESANWDRVTTEGQLGECKEDYENEHDKVDNFVTILKDVQKLLKQLEIDLDYDIYKLYEDDMVAIIKEINYIL